MFLEAFCRLWYRKEQSPINPGWKTKHQCMQTSNIWQLNLQPVEKKALLEPLIVTFLDVSFHQWRVWKRRTCSAFHLLDESRWEAEERNDLPGEGNVIKQYFTVVLFLRCAETPGPMGNSHKHKYKWVSLWIRSTWLMPVPAVHLQTSHNHLFPSHHLVRAAPSNFPVLKAHNCRLRKAFPIDGILLRSAPSPPDTVKTTPPVTVSIASNFVRVDLSNTSGERCPDLHANELRLRRETKRAGKHPLPTYLPKISIKSVVGLGVTQGSAVVGRDSEHCVLVLAQYSSFSPIMQHPPPHTHTPPVATVGQ